VAGFIYPALGQSGQRLGHTTHLVHSALSDPTTRTRPASTAWRAAARLANQEVLSWTMEFQKKYCADRSRRRTGHQGPLGQR